MTKAKNTPQTELKTFQERVKILCLELADNIVKTVNKDNSDGTPNEKCNPIYEELPDLWECDISEYENTNLYFNSMMDDFMKGMERSYDKKAKIEEELNKYRGAIPGIRDVKNDYHKDILEIGRKKAVTGDKYTFGDCLLNETLTNRLFFVNDIEAAKHLIKNIQIAKYKFDGIAKGYANVMFEQFLNQKKHELESGGDTTGEDIAVIDTVAHFVILLDKLGVIQKIREEHPTADLNKLLGKIFRANAREQTNIRKTITKVSSKDRKTLNHTSLTAVRKHLLECGINLDALKFYD